MILRYLYELEMEAPMRSNHFAVRSLELHLFFGRIMKEHALFLRAGFTPAAPAYAARAEFFMQEFEKLLSQAVTLSSGLVSERVLCSGELVTEFTALAEKQTQCLTGIPIDQEITSRTACLQNQERACGNFGEITCKVRQLNRTALKLLDGLIDFKETILKCVQRGELFTMNYPLLIEHILREAKLYRKYVETLQREGDLPERMVRDTECFWNQIMMEHAQFIRGLLDPCETELYEKADGFSKEYCALLNASRGAQDRTLSARSLEETVKFRDFKAAGAKGIQQCQIRSIILPLLADHVLREANHYIRLLQL